MTLALFSCGGGQRSGSFNPATQVSFGDFTLNYYSDVQGYCVEDYLGKEESIVIPDEAEIEGKVTPIVGISGYAFAGRSVLKQVQLGNKLTVLRPNAFTQSSVEKLYVTPNLLALSESSFVDSPVSTITKKEGISYLASSDNPYCVAYAADQVTSASLVDGCQSIAHHVFDNVKLTLPSSISNIGDRSDASSFLLQDGVDSLTLGYVGVNACRNLGLKNVTLKPGTPFLGDRAFYNCGVLSGIRIPASVTSIGKKVFFQCYLMNSIEVDEANPVYDSRNHCNTLLETATNTVLVACSSSEIPTTAATILDEAFDSAAKIKSMPFPANPSQSDSDYYASLAKTLKRIHCEEITIARDGVVPDHVFQQINDLRKVTFTGAVTELGVQCFYHCPSLTSVVLPASVEKIGSSAFMSCPSLKEITLSSGLKSIGSSAFSGCSSLAVADLPESLTYIGTSAFADCSSLYQVTLPSTLTRVESKAFENCSRLFEVINHSNFELYPGDANYGGVAKYAKNIIADAASSKISVKDGFAIYAEEGKETLLGYFGDQANIEIPSSVDHIADYALSNNLTIETVTIPATVKSLGKGAFQNAKSLTNVSILAPLAEIPDYAFDGCKRLSKINLPSTLLSIGEAAFNGCDFSEITLPDGLLTLGKDAFSNCDFSEITIPSSVTEIPQTAFSYCGRLLRVNLGNGVRYIGYGAFAYCYRLSSIHLPASLESIESKAFTECYDLLEIVNESALKLTIGSTSNGNIAKNAKAIVSDPSSSHISEDPSGYLLFQDSGETILLGYKGKETSLVLPSSITAIANAAFIFDDTLAYVTLPNGLKTIGNDSFASCTQLRQVNLPRSLVSIGEYAFSSCVRLVEVINESSLSLVPGEKGNGGVVTNALGVVTSKSASRLAKDSSGYLTYKTDTDLYLVEASGLERNVVVPSTFTKINQYAFQNQEDLVSVTIADNTVTDIGKFAFADCTNLGEVRLGAGLTSIPISLFDGCTSLENISFGGTRLQFSELTKGNLWRRNVPATYVTCSDGILNF